MTVRIGIIAPSFRPEMCELRPGIELLEQAGFEVLLGPELLASSPRFTSPFERLDQRIDEFMTMWMREDIDALWTCDGGAGAVYLLPEVESRLIKQLAASDKPKVLFGFSDITFLQMLLAKHMGANRVATMPYHQPWVVPNIWDDADDRKSLRSCLPFIQPIIEHAQSKGQFASGCISEYVDVLRPGKAEGKLLAGNFTCLTHLAGTRFCPNFDHTIVLTEDHTPDTPGQHEYLFWEKLQRLTLSGDWDDVAAFVFGDIDTQGPYADEGEVFPSIYEVIKKTVGLMSEGPIVANLPFGLHRIERPIPIGAYAVLVAQDGRCEMEW